MADPVTDPVLLKKLNSKELLGLDYSKMRRSTNVEDVRGKPFAERNPFGNPGLEDIFPGAEPEGVVRKPQFIADTGPKPVNDPALLDQLNAPPLSPYAKKGATNFTTDLGKDEPAFQKWTKENKVPFDPNDKYSDYDMRGFWKGLQSKDPHAVTAINPNDKQLHFPDYWKTPYHKSFSAESQWADPTTAPKWNDKDQLVTPKGEVVFDERVKAVSDPALLSKLDAPAPIKDPALLKKLDTPTPVKDPALLKKLDSAPTKDEKGRDLLPTGKLPSGTELLTTPQGRHNLWEGIKQEPGRILSGMVETAKKPGEIMKSEKPVTTGEMVEPAADIAMGFGLKLGKQPFSMEGPKGTGGFEKPGPTKEFVTQQEDALFKIVQESEADKMEILKKTEALPEELKNPVMQEKFYHHIEGGPLKEYEKTMFDQTVGLMQTERAELYNRITQAGYPIEDLTSQVHRVVKGRAPQFDALEGSLAADPISGMGRSLPRTTSSLQERKFFALEDQNGNRFVVSKSDAGGTLYHGGKATPTTVPHEITPGNSFSVGSKTFKVVQATTKEIEENTSTRYYKNAWANTADDVVRLKRVDRAIKYLDNLKQTPEWQRFATMDKMKAPPTWIRTQLPQLEGWRMEPELAHVFDDFYGHGRGNLAEKLAKINRFATRSIFWNPNPHIENVAGHWIVGRGWDWVTPQGLRSAFVDSARAIKSTITLDKNYEQMLRDGSALQMARVANQDFYQQLAKKVGMEFEKDPNRWGSIFKTMGFNGIADGVNAYYNGVSKVLWGANDIFMMQRVYELERKGLSRGMAIKEAEKHIPNYRIPSEILGSRAWSELMQNPNIFIFNRYHYGQWGSYARMVADLYKGSPKEKFEALGNMVALGVLSFVIYPYISAGLQKLTGDPKTQKLARGPASIPTALYELWTGDRNLNAFISSVMTMAPGSKEIGEQLSQLDWFTGRHIVEPDDVKNHRWGRVAAQIVNHAAETMVSPYNVLDQYVKDKDAKGPIRAAIDALVGMKEPTERQERGKRAAQGFQRREAAKRARKPRGLIEQIPEYGGPQQ